MPGRGVKEAEAVKVIEKFAENPRELAEAFTRAVADGCPPVVEECKKDAEGWEACDKCFLAWLMREEGKT